MVTTDVDKGKFSFIEDMANTGRAKQILIVKSCTATKVLILI